MRPALYPQTIRLKIDAATREQIIALARHEGLDTSSFVRRELRRVARDAPREQDSLRTKARADV
jgi:antitoxin component of RelBE/YafQ-DinJ toxin-antitoxin module